MTGIAAGVVAPVMTRILAGLALSTCQFLDDYLGGIFRSVGKDVSRKRNQKRLGGECMAAR
jgi:hypothetical protein